MLSYVSSLVTVTATASSSGAETVTVDSTESYAPGIYYSVWGSIVDVVGSADLGTWSYDVDYLSEFKIKLSVTATSIAGGNATATVTIVFSALYFPDNELWTVWTPVLGRRLLAEGTI